MRINALPVDLVVFIMHLYIVLHIIVQCMTDQIFSTTVQETGRAGEDNIFTYLYNYCNYTSSWLLAQWHAFLFRLLFKDGFLLA